MDRVLVLDWWIGIACMGAMNAARLTWEEYLSHEAVSRSDLVLLGTKSPWHLLQHRLDPENRKHTDATLQGEVNHTTLFEPNELASRYHVRPETYEGVMAAGIVPVKPWHAAANACKQWLAEHADKHVVTKAQLEKAQQIVANVRQHPAAKEALRQGIFETTLLWTDPDTGLTIKIRPDWLSGNAIVDLKQTRDASKTGFAKAIGEYQYDVQAALYLDGCEALSLGKEFFIFIAVESDPPHAVGVYQLDAASIEIGRRKYRYWLATYAECVRTKTWPAYSETIELIELPPWKRNLTNGA